MADAGGAVGEDEPVPEGGGARESRQGMRLRPCSALPPAKRHEHPPQPPPPPPATPQPEEAEAELDSSNTEAPLAIEASIEARIEASIETPIESSIETCFLRDPSACQWRLFLDRGCAYLDQKGTVWPTAPLREPPAQREGLSALREHAGEVGQGQGVALRCLEEQREGFLDTYARAGVVGFPSVLEASGGGCDGGHEDPPGVSVEKKNRCLLPWQKAFPMPPRADDSGEGCDRGRGILPG